MPSTPVAVSWGPDHVIVFTRGRNDDALWYRQSLDGGDTFAEWASVGGAFVGDPSAVSPKEKRVDVFVHGKNDDALWHIALVDGHWGQWDVLGGTIA